MQISLAAALYKTQATSPRVVAVGNNWNAVFAKFEERHVRV